MSDYEILRDGLEAYLSTRPPELDDPEVHGVVCSFVGSGLEIVVQSEKDKIIPQLLEAVPIDPTVWSDVGGQGEPPRIRGEKVEIAKGSCVQGGDPAVNLGAGRTTAGEGTVGWSLILNDIPIAIGAWHVFARASNPPPSLDVRLGVCDRTTTIVAMSNLAPAGVTLATSPLNSWDYAFAKYPSPSDIDPTMRSETPGGGSPARAYPTQLASGVSRTVVHWTVGAREPILGSGHFESVGMQKVVLGQKAYWFKHVLGFSRGLADPGDSGAVVIRGDDNSVVGLLFALNSKHCYANPLFLAGWQPIGLSPKGIPMFSGPPELPPL